MVEGAVGAVYNLQHNIEGLGVDGGRHAHSGPPALFALSELCRGVRGRAEHCYNGLGEVAVRSAVEVAAIVM